MNFGQFFTVAMMYTRLQNYTNIVIVKLGIQAFEVVVVVLFLLLLFNVFVPRSAHPLIIERWLVQVYFNVSWFRLFLA